MLDRALPSVRRSGGSYLGELLEAFAFSYYAFYAGDPVDGNAKTAYERAWGASLIKQFASGGGGSPPFIMAIIDESPAKIIIAIPGIQNAAQLTTFWIQPHSVAVTGFGGRVYESWDTFSTTILAQLLADTDFLAATHHRQHSITIAGFSLGAAVGEVLAYKMLHGDPTRNVILRKFGSPLVGNSNWIAAKPAALLLYSTYVAGDPMWLYPQFTYRNSAPFVIPVFQPITWYDADENAANYHWQTGHQEGYPNFSYYDSAQFVASLRGGITSDNQFWFHKSTTYRYMFTQMAVRSGEQLGLRMRYLQHPDENVYQQRYALDCGIGPLLDAPLLLPFGEYPVPQDGTVIQDYSGGGGDADDDYAGGGGDAADWGNTVPMIIAPIGRRVRRR